MSTAIVTNSTTGEVITTNTEEQEILDEAYEELGEDATTAEVVELLTEWLVEDDLHGYEQSDVFNTIVSLCGSMEVLLENPDITLDADTAASVISWGTTSASLSGQADAIIAEASVEEQTIFDELSDILEDIENGDGDDTDYGDTVTTEDTAAMLELAKHANSLSDSLRLVYLAVVGPATEEMTESLLDAYGTMQELLDDAIAAMEALDPESSTFSLDLEVQRNAISQLQSKMQLSSTVISKMQDFDMEFVKMMATVQDKEQDLGSFLIQLQAN